MVFVAPMLDAPVLMPARRRARSSGVVVAPEPAAVPTWEEVAEQHGRFLYTVAYRLTGRREDADDLVQEVLLRVERGLSGYSPGNLRGWLSRITTNAFLDSVRRDRRRPADPLPDDVDRVLPAAPAADIQLATTALPEELQEALSGLAPEFRAAVVLSDVVGLSYADVADALDVPVGTVRSRIHRGRRQLRAALS